MIIVSWRRIWLPGVTANGFLVWLPVKDCHHFETCIYVYKKTFLKALNCWLNSINQQYLEQKNKTLKLIIVNTMNRLITGNKQLVVSCWWWFWGMEPANSPLKDLNVDHYSNEHTSWCRWCSVWKPLCLIVWDQQSCLSVFKVTMCNLFPSASVCDAAVDT